MHCKVFRVLPSLADITSSTSPTTTLTTRSSQVGGENTEREKYICQAAGHQFFNQSNRGTFGDSLLELDWSVGQIMDTLDSLKVRKKNGP